mmetsp:Transcript_20442/g.49480  ORF Transcript_20442/g.49480 Transcript_20442/m.49480 type:complete len:335 (-) Transcript_20442:6303-7307(-)
MSSWGYHLNTATRLPTARRTVDSSYEIFTLIGGANVVPSGVHSTSGDTRVLGLAVAEVVTLSFASSAAAFSAAFSAPAIDSGVAMTEICTSDSPPAPSVTKTFCGMSSAMSRYSPVSACSIGSLVEKQMRSLTHRVPVSTVDFPLRSSCPVDMIFSTPATSKHLPGDVPEHPRSSPVVQFPHGWHEASVVVVHGDASYSVPSELTPPHVVHLVHCVVAVPVMDLNWRSSMGHSGADLHSSQPPREKPPTPQLILTDPAGHAWHSAQFPGDTPWMHPSRTCGGLQMTHIAIPLTMVVVASADVRPAKSLQRVEVVETQEDASQPMSPTLRRRVAS